MKVLKKVLKFLLIFTLIVSWMFNYPPFLYKNLGGPPKIQEAQAASEAFSADGNFNPLDGIYEVTVECWGGGGGGGVINNQGGGGGGGGAYAKSTNVTVAPGSSYVVDVGTGGSAETAGADSTFNSTTVVAKGGGAAANAVAGAGGLASASTWNAIGSNGGTGGAGEPGTSDAGGGGGGAGGPNGAGLDGGSAVGGTYGATGGDSNQGVGSGDGGLGQNGNVGLPGGDDLTYGGGGGGGGDDGYNGGTGGTPGGGGGGAGDDASVASGAPGRCIVSYDDTWAPSVSQASYDPIWTFSTAPNNDADGQISMTATTGYDYNAISYSFTFTACASDGGNGGTSSGWQAGASYTDTGLDPNKCYGYTVQTKDSLEYTGTASVVSEIYSSANVPSAPTLDGATSNSLNLTNNENGNPSSDPITEFAARVVTPDTDATWYLKWVNASGNPSDIEVWLTDAQLTNLTINNLQSATTYGVKVKAKNENGGGTSLGAEGQETTLTAAVPTLTFSISDNTIEFGALLTTAVRWADDSGGSPTETSAHTLGVSISNASGYSITVKGDTLKYSSYEITAIGGAAVDVTAGGSIGTKQFGIRLTVSGGGSVVAPYNEGTNMYAYAATATTEDQVGYFSGASDTSTFSVYYAANIDTATEAGTYTSALTYIATGNF